MAKFNRIFLFTVLLAAFSAQAQLNDVDKEGDFDPEVETMSEEPAAPPAEPVPEETETPAPTKIPPAAAVKRTTPGSGGVIFDWNKYQNATEVPHPFAEKGLLRITRDRTYIYRVDETDQRKAVQVRFGMYNPSNLTAPGENGAAETRFEDNYDQTENPAIMADWEWQAWKSPIGKWGLTLGGGVYIAQGNGHFAGTVNAGLTPREIFTFALIPINVGAVYRLQIWHRQLLVPYATGGGTAFLFTEFRDDNKGPKFGGTPGAYFAAGGALNLSYFDALSRIQLDREYGINAVFLTGEYRQIVSLNKKFDFDSDLINAGFLMEY